MSTTLNAGRQLIKAALDAGFTVAVHYEQDDKPAITRQGSEHLKELWSEATACDEATVYFYMHSSFERTYSEGWAYLVHGNEGDEVVSDHSAKGWVNDWAVATEYGQNGAKVVRDHDNGGFKTVRLVKDGVW